MDVAGAQAVNPTQFSAQQVQQYENPYQQDVINATEAEINNQNQQQATYLQGNSIASGAFGGDRAGVAQAALAGQQDIAANATLAGLNSQNYEQALGEFNTQQGVNLSAGQNNALRQLQASGQLAGLGQTAQNEALGEANAQTNAGTLQQATQQATDTANYNQFLQKQAYPFQTTGWLANIVEGIGSQSGGTSTGNSTTTGSAPSPISGIAGGLLGLSSFLQRGGRVPHKAAGGGLGGLDMPYGANGLFNPTTGMGSTGLNGYVPTINLPVGHTMPTSMPSAPSLGGAGGAAGGTNYGQVAQGLGKAFQNFQNSSLGDKTQDFLQDMFDTPDSNVGVETGGGMLSGGAGGILSGMFGGGAGLARGGKVKGYDDGGPVTTDPTWDLSPEALLDQANAQRANLDDPRTPAATQALGAAMGAAPPTTPTGVYGGVTPAAAYANQMPAPSQGAGAAPTEADYADQMPAPQQPSGIPAGLAPARAPVQPIADTSTDSVVSSAAPTGLNPDARGMRNNNPGNLVDNAWTQGLPGYVGTDGRFAKFDSPQAGAAALDRNLQSYAAKGISTPLQIASTWAPAGDGANVPASYAAVIAKTLGVGPNDPVNLADPATRGKVGQAIAFVENGPGKGAPASNAIASSAPAAGGLGNVTPTGVASDQEGQQTQETPQRSGLLGLNLPANVRQGLLAAGLGMMAGTSRNPLVNIGQGGLQGIAQMNNLSKLQSEIGLQGAQTGYYGAETIGKNLANLKAGAQLQYMMNFLNQHAAGNNAKADAISSNVTAPTVTAPGVTAPTIAGNSASPGAPPPPSGANGPPAGSVIVPQDDPDALYNQAQGLGISELGGNNVPLDRIKAIYSLDTPVRYMDPKTGQVVWQGPYPPAAASSAIIAQQKANATVPADIAKAAGTKNIDIQTAAYNDAAKSADEGLTMMTQAQQMRDNMFDPKTGAPLVNTGPMGPYIQHITALAQQAGVPKSVLDLFGALQSDPKNGQILEKLRTSLGTETAREDLPNGQLRVAEFTRYLATVPNNQILPGAFKYLIDAVIKPRAQQQVGEFDAVKNLTPGKDNIIAQRFEYRKANPYYTSPASGSAAAPDPIQAGAQAEIARRAALRASQGRSQ